MWGQTDIQKLTQMLSFLGFNPAIFPAHNVLLGAGASATPGTAGELFASNGASADPSFQTLSALGIQPAGTYAPLPLPANSVGTSQLAANAVTAAKIVTGAVSTKLNTEAVNQLTTGHVFANLGALIQRFNDRLFVGTATLNDGNSSQVIGDWTLTEFPISGVGAYAYLEQNATLAVGSPNGQPAFVAVTRSSDSGAAGNAAIGISSAVVNDNAIGVGADSWCYYGTTVRSATATGVNTTGMELDVANLGSTVPIFPNQMFNTGQTVTAGLCCGGELGSDPSVTLGINSAAITIAMNDPTNKAKYDKGIVFHALGINGTNGASGTGTAIAFAPGHQINYFNNSNQQTSGIYSSAQTASTTSNQRIQMSDFGTLITDGNGFTLFRVQNNIGLSTAGNYINIIAAASGSSPTIQATGDTNLDLFLTGSGTGNVKFGTYTAGAVAQAGYVTIKDGSGTLRRLLVG